jgi:hydroxymethylglutaryl-CoA lyase
MLSGRHTLVLDTAVGGMGGCPYSGHGRMTRMVPTEDLVDLLHELGIETGIDLDALIEAAHVAEEVVGHSLWGHVSKAGARPRGERLFAMDMPMIETESQAQHFRLGRGVHEDAPSPWREPITSPMRAG